eukprot:1025662_1
MQNTPTFGMTIVTAKVLGYAMVIPRANVVLVAQNLITDRVSQQNAVESQALILGLQKKQIFHSTLQVISLSFCMWITHLIAMEINAKLNIDTTVEVSVTVMSAMALVLGV